MFLLYTNNLPSVINETLELFSDASTALIMSNNQHNFSKKVCNLTSDFCIMNSCI